MEVRLRDFLTDAPTSVLAVAAVAQTVLIIMLTVAAAVGGTSSIVGPGSVDQNDTMSAKVPHANAEPGPAEEVNGLSG